MARDRNIGFTDLPPTTDNLRVVEVFAKQLPFNSTLVVFDIDDTLLTTKSIGEGVRSFYGSDRWFVWQTEDNPGDASVGGCLIDLVTLNYGLMPLEATQIDAPEIVASIPNDKLLLTSRGPVNLGATSRELELAGFKSIVPTIHVGTLDYSGKDDARTGDVVYRDGVMFTSGLNKGAMLRDMLRHSSKRYDYIVMIDDTQKHLDRVKTVMEADGKRFYGVRYTKIKDSKSLPPVSKDQIKSHKRAYAAMLSLLSEVSPEAAGKFAKGCSAGTKPLYMPSL